MVEEGRVLQVDSPWVEVKDGLYHDFLTRDMGDAIWASLIIETRALWYSEPADECSICLDPMDRAGSSKDPNHISLSCKHRFHSSCISRWAKIGRNDCPLCRQSSL